MEHCFGVSGIVYNFNNQNLVTFEDKPVLAYINFETAAPTNSCFKPEQKKGVCCVLRYYTCFPPKSKNG